jgi:hypothetical protein
LADKHLHIISFDIPLPANYGGAIDVFYKLKALAAEGIKIHLHCYEYGRKPVKELEEYCLSVHYYKRKTTRQRLLSMKPYIVVTRNSDELIENLLKDNHPILFEGLHCCYYLDDKRLAGRTKIVRTHNIEHDYYLNLARVERDVFKKYYFYNESYKLQRFEKVLNSATGIAAISKNDLDYFAEKYRNVNHVSAFHPNEKVEIKPGKGEFVLYHGSLEVGENNEAALFLVNQVFSDLKIPFVIAGNKPSKELKEAVAKYKHITLKSDSSTDEIYQLIADAQINILPTFQSTGIKLKLLAALYSGRHCIVNSFMVEKTGLEEICTVANTSHEMQETVKKLFKQTFSEAEIENRKTILLSGFGNRENILKLIKVIYLPQPAVAG